MGLRKRQTDEQRDLLVIRSHITKILNHLKVTFLLCDVSKKTKYSLYSRAWNTKVDFSLRRGDLIHRCLSVGLSSIL